MAKTMNVTVEEGLGILRIGREHGNAINDTMVGELMAALHEAEEDPALRGLLLASSGKLFSPGLDLQELIELDRPAMERFVRRFNACFLMLYTFSKPLVAAVHGHAIAGGYLLTLTADRRVLKRGAKVGLAEIKVGVPIPFGISMIVRETIPQARVEEVALLGRNYESDDALAAGLVHEVHDGEDFEPYCLERLREMAEKDGEAFAITKRYLRSATVERIRANDAQFAEEFLGVWFTPSTQERIRAIVEGIKG